MGKTGGMYSASPSGVSVVMGKGRSSAEETVELVVSWAGIRGRERRRRAGTKNILTDVAMLQALNYRVEVVQSTGAFNCIPTILPGTCLFRYTFHREGC